MGNDWPCGDHWPCGDPFKHRGRLMQSIMISFPRYRNIFALSTLNCIYSVNGVNVKLKHGIIVTSEDGAIQQDVI